MAFRLSTPYYGIPGSQPEQTFGAIVEMLLKTRLRLKLETKEDTRDEEVNAYLAGVLVSYLDPTYLTSISRVLSDCDTDVFESATKSDIRYRAYWVYKVNADDMLVSLGIFERLWQDEKSRMGRMQRYYSNASEFQRQMHGKSNAVSQILEKLSEESERYLEILAGIRSEYFQFIDRLKPEEMDAFSRQIGTLEKELPARLAQDELLDVYSAWLKSPGEPGLKERLVQLAAQMQELDPAFQSEIFLSQVKNPSQMP